MRSRFAHTPLSLAFFFWSPLSSPSCSWGSSGWAWGRFLLPFLEGSEETGSEHNIAELEIDERRGGFGRVQVSNLERERDGV